MEGAASLYMITASPGLQTCAGSLHGDCLQRCLGRLSFGRSLLAHIDCSKQCGVMQWPSRCTRQTARLALAAQDLSLQMAYRLSSE